MVNITTKIIVIIIIINITITITTTTINTIIMNCIVNLSKEEVVGR